MHEMRYAWHAHAYLTQSHAYLKAYLMRPTESQSVNELKQN